jgi:hypothetical protein
MISLRYVMVRHLCGLTGSTRKHWCVDGLSGCITIERFIVEFKVGIFIVNRH